MIEPGLVSRLKAQVASVSGRVDPVKLPQNPVYPHLTVTLVDDPRFYSHDGPDGLVSSRYQITVWDERNLQVKITADEVRQALEGFVGDMNGHHVAAIMHLGGRDLFDDEVGVHFNASDYGIQYTEN